MDNIRRCDIKANVLVGDSIEKSKEFKDKSIDFLFIDGCHSYPYVEEELKVWMPKLKKNSMICGHDYNTNAVKMAVKNVIGDVFETSTGQSYYQIFGKGIENILPPLLLISLCQKQHYQSNQSVLRFHQEIEIRLLPDRI